jgi:anti-anti-sigma regulatory factor
MIEVEACAATSKTTVRLAGTLDVRDANRLQSVLNGLLAEGQNGTVDCSALESLDTACVQVLLAAKRDTRGSVELAFDDTSEVTKWFDYAGATARLRATSIGQTSTVGEARS